MGTSNSNRSKTTTTIRSSAFAVVNFQPISNMKISLFFCLVLSAIIASGFARSLHKQSPEEKLIKKEAKLISRMKRHQADTLFNHYRRRNKINLLRKLYLQQLMNGLNRSRRSTDEIEWNGVQMSRYAYEMLSN